MNNGGESNKTSNISLIQKLKFKPNHIPLGFWSCNQTTQRKHSDQ